jgi:uncharacterized OB-fold protein
MSEATTVVPVDESLFFALSPPQLAGSRCSPCGAVVFPAAAHCPCCSSAQVARVPLPVHGTLWSWTIQRFEPKLPYIAPAEGFEPFALGYVDLGEVLVESRLLGDSDSFRIGQPLQLEVLTLPPATDESAPVITFSFGHGSGLS